MVFPSSLPGLSPSDRTRRARSRLSQHGGGALLAMLAPALIFPAGLFLLRDNPQFAWLQDVGRYPWQFWAVAGCGTAATLGGLGDWFIHRSGLTTVGRREHRAHLAALVGGGLPLFVLMACASLRPTPEPFLLPILVVLIFTVVLISYDEFVFHRRCGRFETLAHRLLTFGNGMAFLAWSHWCFVGRSVLP